MRVIVQPVAVKALARLPSKDGRALMNRIAQFAANPFKPFAAAKPLVGAPQTVRIRHGDWRAICRIDRDKDVIIVEMIGGRKDIYR